MKKVLSIVLVVAMMLSTMMLTTNAASYNDGKKVNSLDDIVVGDLYTISGGYFSKHIIDGSVVNPGSNIYMILATYTNYTGYDRSNYSVKKAAISPETDSRNVVAKTSSAATKTVKFKSDTDLMSTTGLRTIQYKCAEIPVKAINVTKNDYDSSFNCQGYVNVTFSNGDTAEHYFDFDAMYDVGETLSEDYTTLVQYESQDEIDITDDEDMIEIEATATGTAVSRLTVDYDIIDEIDEIYGDYASLEYLKVTGSLTRVKNCTVRIFADGSRYLYKYEDGVLVDLSSYYNSSEDAFVMKQSGTTINFGTYVISDVKLSSAKAPASTTTTTTSSGTAVKPVVPTTPGSTVKPVIPNTGVALELQ